MNYVLIVLCLQFKSKLNLNAILVHVFCYLVFAVDMFMQDALSTIDFVNDLRNFCYCQVVLMSLSEIVFLSATALIFGPVYLNPVIGN